MAFSDASRLSKIAVLISVVSSILFLVAYGTDHWIKTDFNGFSGLWSYNSDFGHGAIPHEYVTDKLQLTRTLESLGIIAGMVCIFLNVLSMIRTQKILIRILSGFSGIAAGVFIFIGIIIYSTDDFYKDFNGKFSGYSSGLAIFSGVVYILAGVLIFVDIRLSSHRSVT
ncbi:hypothetical protein SNE40_010980 [Patella caerulea]|uniref:Uncharacterized protein n=1 Tax=Patella caerulea TaxID=87958 RepID=A0AAN8Q5S0_PATCE